jgi:hypothetical protein
MAVLPRPPRPLPPGWLWRCLRLFILGGVSCGLAVTGAGAAGLVVQKKATPDEAAVFESGKTARATVTDKRAEKLPGTRVETTVHKLEYRFDAGGVEVLAKRTLDYDKAWNAVNVGEAVEVVYDPKNPKASFLAAERDYYTAMRSFLDPRIGIIVLGIGLLVIGSNLYNFRKELRYFSHGAELAADLEEVERKEGKITYKATYIWEGREYWYRQTVGEKQRLVVDENGKGVLIMEHRKADRVTLITRDMYDVEPPPKPESPTA